MVNLNQLSAEDKQKVQAAFNRKVKKKRNVTKICLAAAIWNLVTVCILEAQGENSDALLINLGIAFFFLVVGLRIWQYEWTELIIHSTADGKITEVK